MDDVFGQPANLPPQQGAGDDPFGMPSGDAGGGFMGAEGAPPLGDASGMGDVGFAAEPLPGGDVGLPTETSAADADFGSMAMPAESGGAGAGDMGDLGGLGDAPGPDAGEGGGVGGDMGSLMGGGDAAGSMGMMGGGGDMGGDMGGLVGGDVAGVGDLGMMGGGGDMTGDMAAALGGDMGNVDSTPAQPADFEPSAVAKWRMEQEKMIEEKKAAAAAKAEDMQQKAKADLDALAQERASTKEKRTIANRSEQEEMMQQRESNASDEGQAVWSKVGFMCDLKEKANPTVDTNRMRNLLVGLKHG